MRLIDADHTEKVFSELMNLPHDYCGPSDIKISIDAVFRVLGQVPDADPVKHGRWIFKGNGNADCSCCGYRSSRVYDDDNADRYCRHCGAKMDGDADE